MGRCARGRVPLYTSGSRALHLRPNCELRSVCVRAEERTKQAGSDSATSSAKAEAPTDVETAESPSEDSKGGARRRKAESTDWIASTLTRRFGIAGGLAWVAFLAIGTLGEQVKTRLEVAQESKVQDVSNSPVLTLPGGITYQDLRVGGGSVPTKGYLCVLNYKLSVGGELIDDTFARNKPIVVLYKSRPFTGGMNAGLEAVLSDMKAGGKRRCRIPPEAGFGDQAFSFKATRHVGEKTDAVVPPNSVLDYELELVRVSVPPS